MIEVKKKKEERQEEKEERERGESKILNALQLSKQVNDRIKSAEYKKIEIEEEGGYDKRKEGTTKYRGKKLLYLYTHTFPFSFFCYFLFSLSFFLFPNCCCYVLIVIIITVTVIIITIIIIITTIITTIIIIIIINIITTSLPLCLQKKAIFRNKLPQMMPQLQKLKILTKNSPTNSVFLTFYFVYYSLFFLLASKKRVRIRSREIAHNEFGDVYKSNRKTKEEENSSNSNY